MRPPPGVGRDLPQTPPPTEIDGHGDDRDHQALVDGRESAVRTEVVHRLSRQAEQAGEDQEDYQGEVADKIVSTMENGGGLITHEDLAAYQVVERMPTRGSYRGFQIASMPPPSSGCIHIVQILNVLEFFPLSEYGPGSAQTVHLLTEAMRFAFADRSRYLGDPDFFKVPSSKLTSKAYAKTLANRIQNTATPSRSISPGAYLPEESRDTTHF